MTRTDDRAYLAGQTVRLVIRLTDSEDGSPADGTVTLDALKVLGPTGVPGPSVLPTSVSFTRFEDGGYALRLETVGFAPGTYRWRAKATNSEGITLGEDTFVLRAPA